MEKTVQLSGQDGNIFFLLGIATKTMKKDGASRKEIQDLCSKLQDSKSYDNALRLIIKTLEKRGFTIA